MNGAHDATVAQQVEQLTRNEQVVRSNRISSSKMTAEALVYQLRWLFFYAQSLKEQKRGCRTKAALQKEKTTG